jgi:acrylyl-CoA reductase (NADPH)
VSLLGVASAGTARAIRDEVWAHLSGDWKPVHLDRIAANEVALDDLAGVFEKMLAGGSLGRTVVRVG